MGHMASQWPITLLLLVFGLVTIVLPQHSDGNTWDFEIASSERSREAVLQHFTLLYNKNKGTNVSVVPIHPAGYDYWGITDDTNRWARRKRQGEKIMISKKTQTILSQKNQYISR
ncbi:hypothetical protein Aduo_019523 [Ancylostoma duodenale]